MGTQALKTTLSGCVLLTLFVLGCVMQPLVEPFSEPDWVRIGSGAAETEQGRVFNGVGIASGLQSRVLLRASADNLAREELARVLDRFIRALGRNQRADAKNGHVENAGSQISFHPLIQTMLRDAVIEDHWTDSRDGRLFALCRLNLETFKKNLARDRKLEMALRNTMLDRADRVHAQMAGR